MSLLYNDKSKHAFSGDFKKHCLNVRGLKIHIHRVLIAEGKKTNKDSLDIGTAKAEAKLFDSAFLEELENVNRFYIEKERELFAAYENIKQMNIFAILHNPKIPQDQLEDLPEMLSVFFGNVRALRHFVQWNYSACMKSANEYCKKTNSSENCKHSLKHFQQLVEQKEFYRAQGLADMVHAAKELNGALQRHSISKKEGWFSFHFSFESVFCFVVAISLLEILALNFFKERIQSSGTPISLFLQSYLHGDFYSKLTEWMHFKITSQAWLLLCSVIYWAYHNTLGANLYAFVSLGFSLKSLGKAFLKAPRNFWINDVGHYNYCGKGYSLPSGHAMVSLLVLSFIIVKFKKPWILLFTILYEVILFVNVQFIGTHTFMDVVVGWTLALLWLMLYLLIEKLVHKYYLSQGRIPSVKVQFLCFLSMAVFILVLDFCENMSHTPFPDKYIKNMAKVCGLTPERAASDMVLKLEYANTFLTVGVAIGFLLKSCYLTEDYYGKLLWESVVLAIFGGIVFIKMGGYIRLFLLHFAGSNRFFHQASNLLSPIWVLFLAPFIFGKIIDYSPSRSSIRRKDYKSLL